MNRIKQVRTESLGMTQRELAAVLGVTTTTIHLWEVGKSNPPDYLHYALAWLIHSRALAERDGY